MSMNNRFIIFSLLLATTGSALQSGEHKLSAYYGVEQQQQQSQAEFKTQPKIVVVSNNEVVCALSALAILATMAKDHGYIKEGSILYRLLAGKPNYYDDKKPNRRMVSVKVEGVVGSDPFIFPEKLRIDEIGPHLERLMNDPLVHNGYRGLVESSPELRAYYIEQHLCWLDSNYREILLGLLDTPGYGSAYTTKLKNSIELRKKIYSQFPKDKRHDFLSIVQEIDDKLRSRESDRVQARAQAEAEKNARELKAAEDKKLREAQINATKRLEEHKIELKNYETSLKDKVQKLHEKGEDSSDVQKRLLAIGELTSKGPVGLLLARELPQEVKDLFKEVGTEVERFDFGKGNIVQLHLQQEVIDQAKELHRFYFDQKELSRSELKHGFTRLLTSVLNYAYEGELVKAFNHIDVAKKLFNAAKKLLEIDKAIVEGVFKGVENLVSPILHPIQTLQDIRNLLFTLNKVLVELEELTWLTEVGSPLAQQKANELGNELTAILTHLKGQMSEMKLNDWAREGATLGVEFLLPARLTKIAKSLGKVAQESGIAAKISEIQKSERLNNLVDAFIQEAKTAQAGFIEIVRDQKIGSIEKILSYEEVVIRYGKQFEALGLRPTKKFLKHVYNSHVRGGEKAIPFVKSIFNPGENYAELALDAWIKGTQIDEYRKVFDVGRIIGINVAGQETSRVIVVLNETKNGFVTVYPK
jgi:hypothetical protein